MTDFSFEAAAIVQSVQEAMGMLSAPHVTMKPRVFRDGNAWCCLYGENLQDGVAGFGRSPGEACIEFDRTWGKLLP